MNPMRFVKKGVLIPPSGDAGAADKDYAYLPTIIPHNGKLICVYCGALGSVKRNLFAVIDGLRVTRKGVFSYDTNDASIFEYDGNLWCAYSNLYSIRLFVWDKNFRGRIFKGVVIPLGSGGEVDDIYISNQKFFQHNGKLWCAHYGMGASSGYDIQFSVVDGMRCVKKGIFVTDGTAVEVDKTYLIGPNVFSHNGNIWLAAYATNNLSRIALIALDKNFRATKKGVVIDSQSTTPGNPDYWTITHPCFFSYNGKMWCAYQWGTAYTCLAVAS